METIERFPQKDDSYLSYLHIHKYGEEACAPGFTYTQKRNNFYLLHFVVSGTGKFYFEDEIYDIKPGQGFLIEPGTIATYAADLQDPWHYIWVGFNGIMAAKLLNDLSLNSSEPIYQSMDPNCSLAFLRELLDQDFSNFHIHFYLLGSFYKFLSTIQSVRDTLRVQELFEDAMEFISGNYLYNLKVEDISKHLCIDRSYLYKLFMENIHVSPQEYLIRLKVDKAAELLSKTDDSVGSICYLSGFHDLAHFSKTFKSRMGLSPMKYRTAHKKAKD